MKFLNLETHNFGVFRGVHVFDLNSITPNEHHKNITVFTGHNGAGKSTLFQAIQLAVHGKFILGDRPTHQEYNDFILSRLHKQSNNNSIIISRDGGVRLSLEYIESGIKQHIGIERNWKRSGTTISEKLSLRINNHPPDIREEDFQFWLNEIFPPGLAAICFYDAEKLDALSNPLYQSNELANLISRLSGLDLAERLQSDLDYYLHRQQKGQKIKLLREKVLQFQASLDDIENNIQELQSDNEQWDIKESELRRYLAQAEQNLISEGGSYAARRPILKERLENVEVNIEEISEQLRELATQLLPFTLAPILVNKLSKQLSDENYLYRQQVANELWDTKISNLEDQLLDEGLWEGIRASKKNREAFSKRFISNVKANKVLKDNDVQLVHHLAEPEHKQLQQWISHSLYSIPSQVDFLGKQLKNLREEQKAIRIELQRAPENDVLAPIFERISEIEKAIGEVKGEQNSVQAQIGAFQYQREDLHRQFLKAGDDLRSVQAHHRQFEFANRTKVVLSAYKDALMRQRLGTLETAIVQAFNLLCQKEQLLSEVSIHPETFIIKLNGVNGLSMDISDFSAGERQLFAMALINALRNISKQKLPLFIDTPLARLDEVHRNRLMVDYFPTVSEQVILFATDAEMNDEFFNKTEEIILRTYQITFDPDNQMSSVDELLFSKAG
jgi:DNA sulfur modification protein DndD